VLRQIADAYHATRKQRDIPWNRWVARPAAAVLLVPLAHTRVTPNQITLLSLVVFAGAAVLMAVAPGQTGLVLAVIVIELSYVLDCADGQLARLRGTSTPVGAHLDFLMDELKAFLLVAAVGVRLWRFDGSGRWLLEALVALLAVASAISLTTFVRRPEYAAAVGQAASTGAGDYGGGFGRLPPSQEPARRSFVARVIGAMESLGRFFVHYPSYLPFVAVANRIDIFLHVYLAVNAAHTGRSLLAVAHKLGRPSAPRAS